MSSKEYREASTFLEYLDSNTDRFTFQTFDNSPEKRPELTKILNGTLEEHWNQLWALNNSGAGIYVNVQETDLQGRRKENVTNIRAVFIENDIGIDINTLPLRPSFAVLTSPGHSHIYYTLKTKQSVEHDDVLHEFNMIMKGLIDLGSDPAVKDIARVLRVPGFKNYKHGGPDEWHDVTLVEFPDWGPPNKYPWSTLVDTFATSDEDFFDQADQYDYSQDPFENARVYSALKEISPDCDYEKWMQIGMAIHHASSGSQEGYEIFHGWSQEGEKYNENDWPHKWQSFKQTTDKPIRIGTLYKYAKDAYWDEEYYFETKFERHLLWRQKINSLNHLNKRFGLVTTGHKVRILERVQNEQNEWITQLRDINAVTAEFQNDKIPYLDNSLANPRIKYQNRFSQWMAWEGRRTFKGLRFIPHKDIQLDTEQPWALPDTEYYNTYLGLSRPGYEAPWPQIEKHLREVWCRENDEAYDYIIHWLAYMFQNPGKPAGTCVVIRSDRQGAGKNIIADHIARAFGSHGTLLSTSKHITGNFNSIMAESIFTVLSEAVWAGSHEAKSFLKSAITDPFIVSEKKFEDARKINNCSHLMCLSNEDWIVPIEVSDRRYFILDCDCKYARNRSYFSKLARAIHSDEGNGFIYYLRHLDLEGFVPADMPELKDDTKLKNMEFSFNDVESYVFNSLAQRSFLFSLGEFTDDEYGFIQKFSLSKKQVYDAYVKHVQQRQRYGWETRTQIWFGRELGRILKKGIESRKLCKSDGYEKPENGYDFYAIVELREIFKEYIGTHVDWDDIAEEGEKGEEKRSSVEDLFL